MTEDSYSTTAIDTPARLAVLGAGPLGLEATLYARYLGYDVDLFEQADVVAANVRQWSHVRMFSPFAMNHSSLGLAAIAAQDESYQPPEPDELLTGGEWIERYLEPLSRTDLVAGSLRLGQRVEQIGRDKNRKTGAPGDIDRRDSDLRLLCQSASTAEESIHLAEGVIDTTGVFNQPNWLGTGGIPALGERALQMADPSPLHYGLPDILGADRARYADRRVLVVGAGYSAATNVCALADLAGETATTVVWVTRSTTVGSAPLPSIPNDRLPSRRVLTEHANKLANANEASLRHLAGYVITEVKQEAGGLTVTLESSACDDDDAEPTVETIQVDEIIGNVGFRPDRSLYRELQVHECYASEGPMKLAAALLGQSGGDCLDAKTTGANTLISPEPDFYIVGSKSYGRGSQFLYSLGLEQIREVFTLIGDRAGLNLYATASGSEA